MDSLGNYSACAQALGWPAAIVQRQLISCGRGADVRAPHVALASATNLIRWLEFAASAGSIALSAFVHATALSAPAIGSYPVGNRFGSSCVLSLTPVPLYGHRWEIGADGEEIVPETDASALSTRIES